MNPGLGQAPNLLETIGARVGPTLLEQLGPGLMYVKLSTPIGVAVVDPFAPPDPTTHAIMQRLGIEVTVGFGDAPPATPGEGSLVRNLSLGGLLGAGALAFIVRPKLSTLVAAAAGVVLVNAVAPFFPAGSSPVEA